MTNTCRQIALQLGLTLSVLAVMVLGQGCNGSDDSMRSDLEAPVVISPPPPTPTPMPSPTQTCEIRTLPIRTYGAYCPVHTRGDREFDGNGPRVTVTARLEKRQFDTSLALVSTLSAVETQSDWTTGSGTFESPIATGSVSYPWKITQVYTPTSSNASYEDTDHDYDYLYPGGLVGVFKVKGDTAGNDLGNCTTDDAHMYVTLNEIRFQTCRPL